METTVELLYRAGRGGEGKSWWKGGGVCVCTENGMICNDIGCSNSAESKEIIKLLNKLLMIMIIP